MIDNLSLAISHGLMLLAVWRLLSRVDLDDDRGQTSSGFLRQKPKPSDRPDA